MQLVRRDLLLSCREDVSGDGSGLLVRNVQSHSTIHCVTDKRGRKKKIHLEYEVGQRLIYQDECKGNSNVTVIDVGLDEEFDPVYTVQFPDGLMKDTDPFHLIAATKECVVSLIGRDRTSRTTSFSRRSSGRISNLSRATRYACFLDSSISTCFREEKTCHIVLRRKSTPSFQVLLQGERDPKAATSSNVFSAVKTPRKNNGGSKKDKTTRKRKCCGIDEFPTHFVVYVMFFHFKILK